MRTRIGLGVLAVGGLLLGGCALDEQEGGIASVLADGAGDGGYWVHEHMHNLGLRSGSFETLEEAEEVAAEHNAAHHMGTRTAYVSERADGLGAWHRAEMPGATDWELAAKPRELPNTK